MDRPDSDYQLLSEMLDLAPCSITIHDPEGNFLFANGMTFEIHGYDPEEFMALNLHELDAPVSEALIEERMQAILRDGHATFEVEHRRKNGEWFPLEVFVKPVSWGGTQAFLSIALDISRRREAEDKLRRHDMDLDSLLNAINESVCLFEPDGTVVVANAVFAERVGLAPRECVGRDIYSLIPPETAAARRVISDEVLRTGVPVTFEDERYGLWLRHSLYPVFGPDGTVRRIAVFAADITSRKRSEQMLEESEKRWRNILVHTPQVGVTLDPAGRVSFANRQLLDLTGWSEEEVVGQNWFDLFIPENIREDIRGVFRQVMEAGAALGLSNYENDILTRDGSTRRIAWSNLLTRDGKGNISGVTCLGIDISERAKAQEKMKEMADTLQAILETAPVGIGGVKNRILLWGNTTLSKMLGFTIEEFKGLPARKLYFSDEEYERVGREKYAQMGDGGSMASETVFRRKDGSAIEILLSSANLVPNSGAMSEAVFTVYDITPLSEARRSRLVEAERVTALFELTRMVDKDEETVIRFALEAGVRLTGSEIGYLHFINTDQISLKLVTWSEKVMGMCQAVHDDNYPIEAAGIWMDAFRLKEPVIHNDYPSTPGRKGIPEGHVPLRRHMSVPVLDGEKVVAVAGVGNKALPYTDEDARQLSLFMNSMWEILQRQKAEKELRRWHDITLGREDRVIELKREVNSLLRKLGEQPKYPSAEGRE